MGNIGKRYESSQTWCADNVHYCFMGDLIPGHEATAAAPGGRLQEYPAILFRRSQLLAVPPVRHQEAMTGDDSGWPHHLHHSASIIQSSSYRAGAPQRCFKRRSKCSLSWPPSRPTKGSIVGQPKPRANAEYLAFKDCTLSNSIVAATRSFGLSNIYNLKLYKCRRKKSCCKWKWT